jgi:hypothetical protein
MFIDQKEAFEKAIVDSGLLAVLRDLAKALESINGTLQQIHERMPHGDD